MPRPSSNKRRAATAMVERLPCAAASLVGRSCWVWWQAEFALFCGDITLFEPACVGDVTGEATPHFVEYKGEPGDCHWHQGPDQPGKELVLLSAAEHTCVVRGLKNGATIAVPQAGYCCRPPSPSRCDGA